LKEQEEEAEKERQAELGPGGLHPADVFESLPKVILNSFPFKLIITTFSFRNYKNALRNATRSS
jgi:hypothetical protein